LTPQFQKEMAKHKSIKIRLVDSIKLFLANQMGTLFRKDWWPPKKKF